MLNDRVAVVITFHVVFYPPVYSDTFKLGDLLITQLCTQKIGDLLMSINCCLVRWR